MNLEMAVTDEMVAISDVKPAWVCFVPENAKNWPLAGFDVIGNQHKIARAIQQLHQVKLRVTIHWSRVGANW